MLNREPQINFSLLSGQRMSARVTHASGELELSQPESLKLLVCSVANALINTTLLTSASETVGPWELSLSLTSLPTFSATICPVVLNTYTDRDTPLVTQNLFYFANMWRRLPLQYLSIEKWHLKKKCFHHPQTLCWVHSEVTWEEISLFACFHKATLSLFFCNSVRYFQEEKKRICYSVCFKSINLWLGVQKGTIVCFYVCLIFRISCVKMNWLATSHGNPPEEPLPSVDSPLGFQISKILWRQLRVLPAIFCHWFVSSAVT